MFKKNLSPNFGDISVSKIIKIVYLVGLVPIILSVFTITSSISALSFPFLYPSGILSVICNTLLSLAITIICSIMWKLVCELLYIVFRCLEVYIIKNK